MRNQNQPGIRQFEWPLIQFTLWIAIAAFAAALALNFFYPEFDRRSNVVFGIGLVLTIVMLILFKKDRHYKVLKVLLILILWITFNVSWYLNNGFNYSTIILFAFFFIFIVFIQDRNGIIISSVGMIINLIILYYVQVTYPGFFPGVWNESQKQVDLLYTLFIGWLIIPAYILIAKTNYIKAYKQAQASEELKTSFLANMSHEIRTPLNAIMGLSELILEEPELRNNMKYLKVIHSNSTYLHDLLDQVLNISLIESGSYNSQKQTFQLKELINKLEVEGMSLLGSKKEQVQIRTVLSERELTIHTDPVQLEQVLKNLLNNAVKFTEQGSIEIGIVEDEANIQFYISDTGRGIQADELQHVFNRFVKGSNTIQENKRGIGLGLYLCKRIIEDLGGSIIVNSEFGKGTKFSFLLPKQ